MEFMGAGSSERHESTGHRVVIFVSEVRLGRRDPAGLVGEAAVRAGGPMAWDPLANGPRISPKLPSGYD